MAEIVNLRMARKVKARQTAEDTAAANRARFGQAKTERLEVAREAERAARLLEGARRDTSKQEDI